MTGPVKPQRERVVLARRQGARRVLTRGEMVEQTEIGEALIDGLIRAQLGLAVRCALVSVLVLGSLPLLFTATALGSAKVAGIHLPWLVLGVLVFPALMAVGRLYVRWAERNESDFLDVTRD
ncbi:hypothetical protein [Nocardia shimofusensis]|uniref:hypothetical protein n=1 Tax=Nocardia shimofusensis TaxID=228596 RepID=UPI0009FE0057|nr:hypothetical protein [Nocardia shimofusensis]